MDNYKDLLESSFIEKIEIRINGINGVHEVEFAPVVTIDKDTLPEGLHLYETRHSDGDWTRPTSIAKEGSRIRVNYCGTIITKEKFDIKEETSLAFLGYLEY